MKDSQTICTWFGLNAVVETGPGVLHKAGLGRFIIPHPPLINGLLRWGLPKEAHHTLSLAHEFGHLQTMPFALIYTGVLLIETIATANIDWRVMLFQLISAHATWEIMAELFTMANTGAFYTVSYRGLSIFPRLLFWSLTVGLTVAGWFVILR